MKIQHPVLSDAPELLINQITEYFALHWLLLWGLIIKPHMDTHAEWELLRGRNYSYFNTILLYFSLIMKFKVFTLIKRKPQNLHRAVSFISLLDLIWKTFHLFCRLGSNCPLSCLAVSTVSVSTVGVRAQRTHSHRLPVWLQKKKMETTFSESEEATCSSLSKRPPQTLSKTDVL